MGTLPGVRAPADRCVYGDWNDVAMNESAGGDVAASASVGDLVRRRLSDTDRWNLALVQRDEVWDELRMRHLLDSLLAGYPIGAILLSRVREPARELVVRTDGRRDEVDASVGSWQVLDGQQRINAMFSIFTDKGNYGRFLLDMLKERPAPSPAQGRMAKTRSIPHVQHLDGAEDDLEGRSRFVDLSGWATWAEGHAGLTPEAIDGSSVVALLSDLDPAFSLELSAEEAGLAAQNLRRLVRAWTMLVPILRAEMDTPLDVLEVFSRINLGGVDVAGPDVYFAGVKTFWRDAEARVDQVLAEAPMLRNRLGVLRFLSRLSSRALGHGDVLPLTVDRLSGKKGELLRGALAEVTEETSAVREKLRAFTAWYPTASQLGYVLRQVTPELWDDVLAWVVASPRIDAVWYEENLDLLDAYLLGATMFRYRAVMGDSFRRVAFHEALDAGSKKQEFPLDEILAVVRAKTRLRGGRGRAVQRLASAEDHQALSERSGWILTALAQQIPYEWEPEDNFDWDHIFPRAQASRMTIPGQSGRRRHHPDRHLVNSTGNFWALTSSANRSLKDMVGREKFDRLLYWVRGESGHRVWEKERWSITPEEIESFVFVDQKLRGGPEEVDEAMRIFKSTVTARSRRLLDEAVAQFPRIRAFADDSDAPIHSPQTKPHDYRAALRLDVGDDDLVAVETPEAKRMLRERARSLGEQIRERLEGDGRLDQARLWESNGKSGPVRAFAVFQLVGGNCVELMLTWGEPAGARLEMKAYPRKDQPGKKHQYPDFAEIPLGLRWSARDTDVVTAFLSQVDRVEAVYPRQNADED